MGALHTIGLVVIGIVLSFALYLGPLMCWFCYGDRFRLTRDHPGRGFLLFYVFGTAALWILIAYVLPREITQFVRVPAGEY